jgi:hypothetical protein
MGFERLAEPGRQLGVIGFRQNAAGHVAAGARRDEATPAPMNYSVVVPTVNEVDNIDPLIGRLLALPGFANYGEIIVVDDGSTDGTVDAVKRWCGRGPVRLVERRGVPDLARAVSQGAAMAAHEAVVVMDADARYAARRVLGSRALLPHAPAGLRGSAGLARPRCGLRLRAALEIQHRPPGVRRHRLSPRRSTGPPLAAAARGLLGGRPRGPHVPARADLERGERVGVVPLPVVAPAGERE